MTTKRTKELLGLSIAISALAGASDVAAQDQGGGAPADTGQGTGQGGPAVTVVQVPTPAPAQGQLYGLPSKDYDPNGHLGQGSRPTSDVNGKGDGFDFGPGRGGGATAAHGDKNGAFVVEGQFVPETHSVHRGDTLWGISSKYYTNPYKWPLIWSYNPQITNPHWIYPGDRVRLREAAAFGNAPGFQLRKRSVPQDTVFLRDVGWIDDRKEDTWGEVIASPEDRMLLSDQQDVYLQLDEDHEVALGQELTIFRPIRTVDTEDGKGELVSIRGTVRIERYNPKTHTVRAKIIESLDVIERGARVGPVGRRFDVVPPIVAEEDIEAHVVATIYPTQIIGQHSVVFLDKGDKEGIKPGMRFFAVRRGDRWMRDIKLGGPLARQRPKVHEDKPSQVEKMRTSVDDDLLPDENYAELRVVRVRDHSAVALVTSSDHEIDRRARVIARKGF